MAGGAEFTSAERAGSKGVRRSTPLLTDDRSVARGPCHKKGCRAGFRCYAGFFQPVSSKEALNMRHRTLTVALTALALPFLAGGVRADDNNNDDEQRDRVVRAVLLGANENPP